MPSCSSCLDDYIMKSGDYKLNLYFPLLLEGGSHPNMYYNFPLFPYGSRYVKTKGYFPNPILLFWKLGNQDPIQSYWGRGSGFFFTIPSMYGKFTYMNG